MKAHTEKSKVTTNTHFVQSRWLRYSLALLSIMQAYWPALAVGTATVTAATLFGDKGHLALSKEIETLVAKGTPEETMDYLEKKIDEYHQWSKDRSDKARIILPALPYLYDQLAKAQEATGADFDEIVATYKTVISLKITYGAERHVVAALLWLYENTSEKDYVEAIQNSRRDWNDNIIAVARAFEATHHWSAFERFLDSVASEVDDSVSWAKSVNSGLNQNPVWQERFIKYAQSKPELTEYVFQQYEKKAQYYVRWEDYRKAVEIYRKIVGLCGPNQDKAKYAYKACQALFLGGQYEEAIVELDRFINESESTHRSLTQQAILLKGRSFVHLGQMDRAIETFLKLMVEYPEAKQAPEANFFMGYSYMLQGKFELATESLTLVSENYPRSSYAGKARLCLARIQRMGQ